MKKLSLAIATLPLLALAACGSDPTPPDDDAVTETQMDEVEVIDGTISDDMVDLDTSSSSDEVEASEDDSEGPSTDDPAVDPIRPLPEGEETEE